MKMLRAVAHAVLLVSISLGVIFVVWAFLFTPPAMGAVPPEAPPELSPDRPEHEAWVFLVWTTDGEPGLWGYSTEARCQENRARAAVAEFVAWITPCVHAVGVPRGTI